MTNDCLRAPCEKKYCFIPEAIYTILSRYERWYNSLHHRVNISLTLFPSTPWGRDKMAAIVQTTCSDALYWMKMYELRLRFHWSAFLRDPSTIFQHWSGDKPSSEPMMVSLLTHIFVTRPQFIIRITPHFSRKKNQTDNRRENTLVLMLMALIQYDGVVYILT